MLHSLTSICDTTHNCSDVDEYARDVATHVAEVDVVEASREELDLGSVGVLAEQHAVHAVALCLHVQRQRLRLALDVADDVEVDVLVARRFEREADGLARLGRDPPAERFRREVAAVVGHEERLLVEDELDGDVLGVHQFHRLRRLLA